MRTGKKTSAASSLRNAKSPGGALLWIACLQFFLAEQVVRSAWKLPYSFATNYVSDLGATSCSAQVCSPWHALMNASFVLQGMLIAGGVALTWPNLHGVRRAGLGLLLLCGLGVIVVGFVPENANPGLHRLGAAFHFLGGGLGMIAIGLAVRRSFGWISILAGVTVVAAIVALAQGKGVLQTELGTGTIERVAAYGVAGWFVALGSWSYRRRTSRIST